MGQEVAQEHALHHHATVVTLVPAVACRLAKASVVYLEWCTVRKLFKAVRFAVFQWVIIQVKRVANGEH